MSDYVCYWTGCVLDATTRCATCDGWFCREHDDHGPLGDGPHGGGKPTYADLEREVERLRSEADVEMERVKACESIAEGDEGWERLSNLCPSTAAVSALRAHVERLETAARDVTDDDVMSDPKSRRRAIDTLRAAPPDRDDDAS